MTALAPLTLPPGVEQHLDLDADASSRALAAFVGAALDVALASRSSASLLVSGGRSPLPFFAALSQYALDWARVVVSLADERCVPPQHEDSNARLVREHLLCGAAAAARFVPLYEDGLSAEQAAPRADAALGQLASPFDVVVLGMGEDGHTASLFPGTPGGALGLDPATTQGVVAVHPTTAPHARLSLTRRALLASRLRILAIQGEPKRRVLEAAVDASPAQLPIAAFLQADAAPLHLFYCP